MSNSDRPLYEDLLKQRNDLEAVIQRIIDGPDTAPVLRQNLQCDLDEIIGENRRREGLT